MLLEQFVVYSRPRDHPAPFVVRRWEIHPGQLVPGEAWAARTLEAARSVIPPGLVMLERSPDDEPHIVEVWT